MANKNTAGSAYHRHTSKEDHLIQKIDERDRKGTNSENVDEVYNNYHTTDDGSKVWSF